MLKVPSAHRQCLLSGPDDVNDPNFINIVAGDIFVVANRFWLASPPLLMTKLGYQSFGLLEIVTSGMPFAAISWRDVIEKMPVLLNLIAPRIGLRISQADYSSELEQP